jgi:hypothetical protein
MACPLFLFFLGRMSSIERFYGEPKVSEAKMVDSKNCIAEYKED